MLEKKVLSSLLFPILTIVFPIFHVPSFGFGLLFTVILTSADWPSINSLYIKVRFMVSWNIKKILITIDSVFQFSYILTLVSKIDMMVRISMQFTFIWKFLNSLGEKLIQRIPALRGFWDLKKTALREIRVSRTVGDPLLTQKSPTCTYISQKPR